jgi:hypothetical protein
MNLGNLTTRQKLFIGLEIGAGLLLLAVMVAALVLSQPRNQPSPEPTSSGTAQPPTGTVAPRGTPTPTLTPTHKPWSPTPKPTNTRVLNREVTNKAALEAVEDLTQRTRGLKPQAPVVVEYLTHGDFSLRLPSLSPQRSPVEQARWEARNAALGFTYMPRLSGSITDQVKVVAPATNDYFDVPGGKVVIVSDRDVLSEDERIDLSHTYVHALQDQSYGLAQLRALETTTDARLAVEALIEGDATLTMGLYAFGSPKDVDWTALATRAQTLERLDLNEPTATTPLGEIEAFRYQLGTAFALAEYQAGGMARLNQLLQNPPLTSEQILHPNKLGDAPDALYLTDLSPWLRGGWGLLVQDRLGEYVLGLHVREALAPGKAGSRDPAAEQRAWDAVAGWNGDLLQVYGDDDRRAWLLLTAWDSQKEAVQFFEAYRDVAKARLGTRAVELIAEDARGEWQVEGQIAYVSRQGTQVVVLWAPDEATLNALLSQLPGF